MHHTRRSGHRQSLPGHRFIPKTIFTGFAAGGLFLLILTLTSARGGDLNPDAEPNAGSAMYTLEDIYNRLVSGDEGPKQKIAFTEPGADPADGQGKTPDEIMARAPVIDNIDGAAPFTPSWELIGGYWQWGRKFLEEKRG